jgi:hypothetical protein
MGTQPEKSNWIRTCDEFMKFTPKIPFYSCHWFRGMEHNHNKCFFELWEFYCGINTCAPSGLRWIAVTSPECNESFRSSSKVLLFLLGHIRFVKLLFDTILIVPVHLFQTCILLLLVSEVWNTRGHVTACEARTARIVHYVRLCPIHIVISSGGKRWLHNLRVIK